MPPSFNPKVWWLVLGMNDLAKTMCSEEIVVLGILRVAEEILEQKPDAQIVINLLFPMAHLRDDESYPYATDFEPSLDGGGATTRAGAVRRHVAPNFGNHSRYHRTRRALIGAGPTIRDLGMRGRGGGDVAPDDDMESVVDGDRHRIRKYRPLTGFTHRRSVPLFTSIRSINRELQSFASKNSDRVHYFDPTTVFTKRYASK